MKILTAALSMLAVVSACSVPATEGEHVDTSAQRIIRGRTSDATQDAVVLLLKTNQGQLESSCTGTLLAPNLVLTARHCVSQTDHGALCDEKGNAVSGGGVLADYDASDIYVVTGPTVDWKQPQVNARGAKILHDKSNVLCNHDLALITLQAPIKGASLAPVRLDAGATVGETLTAIGWGLTENGTSPSQRMTRTGVSVLAMGPSAENNVASSEFVVGEAICSGDSGGPAIASSGAIIGVVSRGGNGTSSQDDPSASCTGANARNTYTSLIGFKSIILAAYEAVGAKPWLEGGPDPRLAQFGEACVDGSVCGSGLCFAAQQAAAGTCTMSCADAACPEGYECADLTDAKVCRPKLATQSGPAAPKSNAPVEARPAACAASPMGGSSSTGLGAVGFGVALTALVRRRRRR